MDDSLLGNCVWHAVTGPHAHLAERPGGAARYLPDVSVFAGLPDEPTGADWDDLASLAKPEARLVLMRCDHVGAQVDTLPDGWSIVEQTLGTQYVGPLHVHAPPVAGSPSSVKLGDHDLPEMLDLVARTTPGPFRPRALELGPIVGIRLNGQLMAMAAQRMHVEGWSEVSAVCTDPEVRSQGLAAVVIEHQLQLIAEAGDRAFLHVAAHNTGAARLYERLGFTARSEMTATALRHEANRAP